MLHEPEPQAHAVPQQQRKLVSVEFEQQGTLGINFEWPWIESIEPFSLAARHTELMPGLLLIGVQGRGVEGMGLQKGSDLFRNAGRPIRLTFRIPDEADTEQFQSQLRGTDGTDRSEQGEDDAGGSEVPTDLQGVEESQIPAGKDKLWWTKDSECAICEMPGCATICTTWRHSSQQSYTVLR
jgi:hypothetical protein